jgi:chromate reductase, NAD(P)H dehydrogenase (quinone)
MSHAVRLLVTAGSSRAGSYNGRLADVAAGLARDAGAQVTRLDLQALDLPLFHAAIEAAGLPAGAFALRDAFAAHDAVFIASPEYNGFPTPLLINAFAWASRVPAADGKLSGLAAMAGKPAGLVSASPGLLGGLRSLNSLRAFLQMAPAMLVVPEQFALAQAGKAFDESGALLDEKHRQAAQRVVGATLRLAAALRDAPKG